MANSQYPKTVTFSTTIPFDQPLSWMDEYTIASSLTFVKNETGAYPGYGAMVRLVADGVHTPDFTDFAAEGVGTWDNTNGVVNKVFFYFDGSQYCYIVTQPGAGGTGSLPALNVPGSFNATSASSSEIDLTWTDTNSSPNDSGYKIYTNTTNDFGTATVLTTTAANATSYNHTGLSAASTHYYWILAVGDGVTCSDSTTATDSATTSGATLEDINFTTASGISNSSGVWTGTAGSGGGDYAGKGLASKKLLSTNDGYVEFQYVATDGQDAILGMNVTNANVAYGSFQAGVWVSAGGTVYKIDNGSAATTGGTVSTGDYVRLNIVGSTIKVQKSSDHTTWSDLATLTYTRSADMYINTNIDLGKKLYHPKGYNIS